VRDRYGNAVQDRFVTVAASLGTLTAVDESPAPGIQRRLDATGYFTFAVQAADSPGEALISAVSGPGPDPGTASGAAMVTFAPRVRLALVPNTLDPTNAAPGDTIAFHIVVQNLGPAAATFGGATAIRCGEPGGATYQSALAAPVTVPAGVVGQLRFRAHARRSELAARAIHAAPHAPRHRRARRGHRYPHPGDVGAFGVVSLALGAVSAPGRVARGQTGVQVRVPVTNLGASRCS